LPPSWKNKKEQKEERLQPFLFLFQLVHHPQLARQVGTETGSGPTCQACGSGLRAQPTPR
jgi:hypothetical protein